MHSAEGLVLVLVMLVNLYLVSTDRLKAAIQAVATQGALLGVMPLILAEHFSVETIAVAVISIGVKAVAIPGLLFRAMREIAFSRDINPIASFASTLILLAVATGIGLSLTATLPLHEAHRDSLIIPTAISTIMAGIILMSLRKKAITQVVGFLCLENGVFAFGLLLLDAMPLLVEMGVLLDLFAGIFVMAIIINQVNRTFSSLDTQHLSALKE